VARATFGRKLRYWFDNTMARGTVALIGVLAVVSIGMVVLITVLLALIDPNGDGGGGRHPMLELWRNFLAAFDLSAAEVSGHAPFLALRLVLALGGIFLVGALIGILATGQPDGSRRPGDRQPAGRPRDHGAHPARRPTRHAGHQDPAGTDQPPAPATRALPHRRRHHRHAEHGSAYDLVRD